jgi:hypothetical protein
MCSCGRVFGCDSNPRPQSVFNQMDKLSFVTSVLFLLRSYSYYEYIRMFWRWQGSTRTPGEELVLLLGPYRLQLQELELSATPQRSAPPRTCVKPPHSALINRFSMAVRIIWHLLRATVGQSSVAETHFSMFYCDSFSFKSVHLRRVVILATEVCSDAMSWRFVVPCASHYRQPGMLGRVTGGVCLKRCWNLSTAETT